MLTVVLVALSYNSFCLWAKIKTSCFFNFAKHVLEQFVMPPKKRLKADRHNADIEREFSVQNVICTSQRDNILCF